jgi:hypothetical protein
MPLLKINIVFFIFLALATIVSHRVVEEYQPDGPELLNNHWNTRVFANGRVDVNENQLTLFSSDSRTSVGAYHDVPLVEKGVILKLSADVKCNDVVPGEKPWNSARLMLVQSDGENGQWHLPHVIAFLSGTHDWANYYSYFTIEPETQGIQVVAELSQSTGSLQVKNIQLYPVKQTQTFTWVKNIILFSWGVFFLSLIGSCLLMSQKTFILRALLISSFVSIIIGTALPGVIKKQVFDTIETQIHAESESFKAVIPWDLSKVGHLCFFFVLGMMLCVMMAKVSTIHVMTVILLLAGGTEIAQLYIAGRNPLVTDIFIDAAGGIVGIGLIRLFGMNKNAASNESKTSSYRR